MYIDGKGRKVITGADVLHFLRTPLCIFICGVLACALAFNAGIRHARASVEVHSITRHLAFIEIAGQEHVYELDWCEPEPLYWE